uniref:2-oxoglutarate ferredoxin oxidoreductase alpha subunit n=1 Tax=uncultured bacterium W5-51b TaxID=1130999 RepID=H9BX69_9BACT|nr:2-oxoglutarate ferredoxin oxidoreductase alpha subunit [uncultured bacterium W5-51b]
MAATAAKPARETLDSVTIRFAGDSGDGMQLTGSQFTVSTALYGNDLATFPDYPAEIRAPAGTTYGVSSFQINFGSQDILTPGDAPDVLVTMNPAALKVNIQDLREGGIVIADSGAFTQRNLRKAGYESDPLEDDTLASYRLLKLDMSKLTLESVKQFGLSQKEGLRARNFWTLGLLVWMFERKRDPIIEWVLQKFAGHPELANSNIAALNAGHAFGETAELPSDFASYIVPRADVEPGLYRTITGTEALGLGLFAGTQAAGLRMVFASYPITPASPLLHFLAALKHLGVITFQAEDEIAAVCAAIGASYAGALGVTSSSGPGIALKTEGIALAIGTELPLVIVSSQRSGPSTGMPTKSEQADLFQAMYGRHSDALIPVLAAATPADCFEVGMEAVRLTTKYMIPVMLLTDGYLSSAAEPWRIPDAAALPTFPVQFRTEVEGFHPYCRDEETLARPWALPGTPGLEHRIGGLESDYDTGHISYDAENHFKMTKVRAEKVARIANDIPSQRVDLGDEGGSLVAVGWGSTYGSVRQAVQLARDDGLDVSHIHLRYLNPFPPNLGSLLESYDRILVPELNLGQLRSVLQGKYLIQMEGFNRVTGQPFKVREVLEAIRSVLEN